MPVQHEANSSDITSQAERASINTVHHKRASPSTSSTKEGSQRQASGGFGERSLVRWLERRCAVTGRHPQAVAFFAVAQLPGDSSRNLVCVEQPVERGGGYCPGGPREFPALASINLADRRSPYQEI